MSENLTQEERLQAIGEKRKRQAEIENKRRQLEEDRRQLQHLKSKGLRERWLLDGAPSGGAEEDETQQRLRADEIKTKLLEHSVVRLEQELDELETGVPAKKPTGDANGDSVKENGVQQPSPNATGDSTGKKHIMGIEAKLQCTNPDSAIENASAEHPVTMVFMGYKNVEDEAETEKALGLDGNTVKAEFVVIEDGESKAPNEGAKGQAPPNGSAAEKEKGQEEATEKGDKTDEEKEKEKKSCKCCSIM
ncbi:paralemmin 1b isoform X2 [Clupea harengus]|uniref:Paralemmin-1 n=1 Tax=Clupea harengus TaxID=7950 RepID=A0A6P8EI74_CLUHA|nr:paralemmin 1b isoform X2 [Clupea harengus]